MRIQDLLSEERAAVPPKPRNFVAKNAKMGGAGQHKDKKKAEKQGDVKHKKELATMEGVRDLGYDAQSLIMKLRRDIEEKRLQPTREAVLSAARELAGDMDFAPELLVQQVLGKGVAEVSLGDYRKKATMQKAQSQMGAMFNNDPEKQKQYQDTFNKRDRGLNRLKARDEVARKANADKQMSNNIAKLPELRAEYERMKAEYKALGGSNWQYADRDQNLTDRERKARAMEDPMNNLWRTIQSAEKTQRSADDIAETATPGATSAGMMGTVDYPHISPGSSRGKKSYIGSPGKSGTKAPPQPKVNQPKTKHGTAVNALDMKSNIFGGGKAIKRK